MRALLSTHMLFGWSGSELIVIELAESLRRRRVEVTVYANFVGARTRLLFERLGAVVLDDPSAIRPFDFDLVWVQHAAGALFDYTLDARSRERTRFLFAHLSPFEPIERPGPAIESRLADVVLCNSVETRDAVLGDGFRSRRVQLMQNPAPEAFFAERRALPARTMRAVGVVSHHPPAEVLGALSILREEHRIETTRIGVGGDRHERVVPEHLRHLDAVITIGKTVQYALAMGLPVYCYDRFGGPGYLSDDAMDRAERFNFSGRCCGRKRTAAEIAAAIVEGYGEASTWATAQVHDRFHLERRLDSLLEGEPSANVDKAAALQAAVREVAIERDVAFAWRTVLRASRADFDASDGVRPTSVSELADALARAEADVARLRADLARVEERAAAAEATAQRTLELLSNRVTKPSAALRKSLRRAWKLLR